MFLYASVLLIVFACSAVPIVTAEDAQCDAGHCSNEKLKSMVIKLQAEVHQVQQKAIRDVANCTECFSEPCQNNGTCVPLPNYQYRCDCPDNTAGRNCETVLQCQSNSCGPNAHCFVGQHRINCVCDLGYSGSDPFVTGCSMRIVQSCFSGDPHYTSFDGLVFDYQGTCKYIVTEPCAGVLPGIPPFSVRAINERYLTTTVSQVVYAQLLYDGWNIEVNKNLQLLVNGVAFSTPYYQPNQENWNFRVYQSGGIVIETKYNLKITFTPYSSFCVSVPSAAPYNGSETLCGLTGNIDGNCLNDMLTRNMTVLPTSTCNVGAQTVNEQFGDSWIVQPLSDLTCIPGTVLTNNSLGCDPVVFTSAGLTCQPIKDALSASGVFAACQAMGPDLINRAYSNCQFDVCADGNQKCPAFTQFAHQCQNMLPGTSLDAWRNSLNCPANCDASSQIYSGCVSGCPGTCVDHGDHSNCSQPCIEGCACKPGYVLQGSSCIPVDTCGCFDGQSTHAANSEWNTNNCTLHNECHNGTIVSQPFSCDQYATCSVVNQQEACQCNVGFTGNGINCTDINECLDNSTCSQNLGQGTCTNTIGSYNCTCEPNFEGDNCQFYLPRRHCADLFRYHNDTISGIKTIYPSFAFGIDHPAHSPLTVLCNMEDDNGGWTAFTGNGNSSIGKAYDDYVNGFGNVTALDFWLGLDFLYGATHEFNTSLRIELNDCYRGPRYWKYDQFTVSDGVNGYAPYIPDDGTGTAGEGWTNPWIRGQGPTFAAGENCNVTIPESQSNCCRIHGDIGWWYGNNMCGQANLNGVRYSCDYLENAPSSDPGLYLAIEWNSVHNRFSSAQMLLRPAGFPIY